ncbi:helix-turn-helix transcriptional regulator [Glycomyces scopariae]
MEEAPAGPAPAYEERHAPAAAAAWSACLWVRRASAPGTALIVPDGCTDLLWRAGRLEVAGPDTGPRDTLLVPGEVIVGVRLRPGAARVLLGPVPATAVRDAQPALDDLRHGDPRHDDAFADRLAAQSDPWLAAGLLAHALLDRALHGHAPDPVALAAAAALDRPRPLRIPVLARELGLSERQLRRRILDAAGYGPKTLEQILRFRRATAAPAPGQWARTAAEAGYADQAHLSREVRRWSGRAPTRARPTPGGSAPP